MLKYHISKNADCTIATLEVTLEEATRFGIMNTDEDNIIYEFEEKPAHPKSTKASMGIYIFKREKLNDYLVADAQDPNSSNDFGKNIIPTMLAKGEKMVAYPFSGYWKDVGTIASLWEANQDLIGENPKFDIYDPYWKIHSRNIGATPQYVAKGAVVENSLIGGGANIYGTVINSVISSGVTVQKGAVVKDSVIFANANIGPNSVVEYSIIDENVKIGAKATVGEAKEQNKGIAVVGRGSVIKDNEVVPANANIDQGGAR